MNTVCWAQRQYSVDISTAVATVNWATVYPVSPSVILSLYTVWSVHAETPIGFWKNHGLFKCVSPSARNAFSNLHCLIRVILQGQACPFQEGFGSSGSPLCFLSPLCL